MVQTEQEGWVCLCNYLAKFERFWSWVVLISARNESAKEDVKFLARVAIHSPSNAPYEGKEEQALEPKGDCQLGHLSPTISSTGLLDLIDEAGVESHQGGGEVDSGGHHKKMALVANEVYKNTTSIHNTCYTCGKIFEFVSVISSTQSL